METYRAPVKIVTETLSGFRALSEIVSRQGRSYQADAKLITRYRKANTAPRPKEPSERSEIPTSFFEKFQLTSIG